MIDLNNTWCEATEENYNGLIKLGKSLSGCDMTTELYFLIENGDLFRQKNQYGNRKQIHLVNGEFQYVETKPKNNFKEYGFEADFEGEILKELEERFIGIAWNKYEKDFYPRQWHKNGKCFCSSEYNLKPIKKEWYENPDNIGKFIVYQEDIYRFFDINYILNNAKIVSLYGHCKVVSIKDIKPATKEEVLSLLVKE